MATRKLKKLADKTKTDAQLYWKLMDWSEYWQEFLTSIDKSGRYRYPTAGAFARAKARSPEQERFLKWYLGPHAAENPDNVRYAKFAEKSQDWKHRRDSGSWYGEQAMRGFSQKVAVASDALSSLREVGNKVALNSVARFEKLQQKLDASFLGELFLDELPFADNVARAKVYFDFHRQLEELKKQSIETYALTQGVNFNDMQGYAQLIQGVQLAAMKNVERSRVEECLGEIARDIMIKHRQFDVPLPESITKTIEAKTIDSDDDDTPKDKIH